MVATSAHQIGSVTSAISPRMMKTAQKIFFSTRPLYASDLFFSVNLSSLCGYHSWIEPRSPAFNSSRKRIKQVQ